VANYIADVQASLADCYKGRNQKLPFEVNAMIELKHVTTTSDNTGTLLS
jgi:hypothetical protein